MGTRTFIDKGYQAITPRSAKSGDMSLLITIIALVAFGLLMLYSASADYSVEILGEVPSYMFKRQLLWLLFGIVIAFAFSLLDYHHWRRVAVLAMLGTIIALVAVLFIQELRLGAVRTFYNGSIQPSELAKVVIIIYLSVWLYAKRAQLHSIELGLIPLAIILGLIGGLIYLQPDISATATIFILGGVLFFLAGADLKQIIILILLASLVAWAIVQVSATGQERVEYYRLGLQDPTHASYHVRRALEAIVNGGVFGLGIGQSVTKLTGLPVPPTDSIFAVIAEEFGLVGATVLILLYAIMVWRGLVIARRAPDMLGSLLATGLVFWIAIEALINMTVMVGLLPFAGNALPFISAGGSSLVTSLAAIGILFNISRQRGENSQLDDEWRAFGATANLRRRNGRRGLSRTRRS
ncbi:MAG: cell division protein FtsW [Anaerolineae bacterium]|jgi:cell division protein FtsW|nr:cell division protein FtsW [Anaerolineae bacterium]MBT3712588.1 cell division protein FtsW [Anaerolineae bacterium]MBT4310703.1 cell division protein FtsW [Anaerolineae bacterium]MBT4457879.1 cell division protein FtsW [Anaerolineae bacterium]MBT4842068.1 cell division protein FtsW [Anaerolineae bacterium]